MAACRTKGGSTDGKLKTRISFFEIFIPPRRGLRYIACEMATTAAPQTALPNLDHLTPDALRALILTQQEQLLAQQERLLSREAEIEHLRLLLTQLRRLRFGRKSEKLELRIEQLELKLEELEARKAEQAASAENKIPPQAAPSSSAKAKPARRPLPEHLPRETKTREPKQKSCPDCGGELRKLGEDVSEMLEYVPAYFKVIRHVRPKLSCTGCDCIVQAPAASRPIAHGLAGPGLLAHVLVSKFADHLPLYRQAEIYARAGMALERSTLADWVGGTSRLLEPLVEALRRHVMAAGKLHADDTRRCRCWLQGKEKQKLGDCGPMYAMTVPPTIRRRQRFGSLIRPTIKVSIPSSICGTSPAFCKRMPTPVFIIFMKMAAFRKQLVGSI